MEQAHCLLVKKVAGPISEPYRSCLWLGAEFRMAPAFSIHGGLLPCVSGCRSLTPRRRPNDLLSFALA